MANELARRIRTLEVGILNVEKEEVDSKKIKLFFNVAALKLIQDKLKCKINEIDFSSDDPNIASVICWAGQQWLEKRAPKLEECEQYNLGFKEVKSLPVLLSNIAMSDEELEEYLGKLQDNYLATAMLTPDTLAAIQMIMERVVRSQDSLSELELSSSESIPKESGD